MIVVTTSLVYLYALIAQLDRAFGYGPKGLEFESLWVHQIYRLHIEPLTPTVYSLDVGSLFLFFASSEGVRYRSTASLVCYAPNKTLLYVGSFVFCYIRFLFGSTIVESFFTKNTKTHIFIVLVLVVVVFKYLIRCSV